MWRNGGWNIEVKQRTKSLQERAKWIPEVVGAGETEKFYNTVRKSALQEPEQLRANEEFDRLGTKRQDYRKVEVQKK